MSKLIFHYASLTIPDIRVGENSRIKHRMKKRYQSSSHNPRMDPICEDQCLAMMESMSIYKGTTERPETQTEPVSEGMQVLKIEDEDGDDPKSTREMEDYWEDFSN